MVFLRASIPPLVGLLLACGVEVTEPMGGDSMQGSTSGSEVTGGSAIPFPEGETTVGSAGDGSAGSRGGDTGASTSEGAAERPSTGEDSTGTGPAESWCDADDPDLVACYDFQDVAQLAMGVLPDGSSYGNTGTISNVEDDHGPLGHAVLLAESSVISVNDDASLNLTHDMSFDAFFRVDMPPMPGTRMGILDNDGQYAIFVYPDAGVQCNMYGVSVFAPLPPVGHWLHVACVLEDGIHEMFIDGVSVGSTTFTVTPDTSNTNPVAIGNDSPSWADPLLGAIGGVRVWARPLDDEDVCRAAGPLCRR